MTPPRTADFGDFVMAAAPNCRSGDENAAK